MPAKQASQAARSRAWRARAQCDEDHCSLVMFSTYSVTTTLVSAFTRHCVPLHACLAQHLTEGARSRAWAAHDETVVHERALDVVHLADLSASRRQADDCMVQGTSVVVRHQVIRRAYFVTTRQAKEHANECSLSRCTRPAEQMKPTYGIASSIQHPQHAPASTNFVRAGFCNHTHIPRLPVREGLSRARGHGAERYAGCYDTTSVLRFGWVLGRILRSEQNPGKLDNFPRF